MWNPARLAILGFFVPARRHFHLSKRPDLPRESARAQFLIHAPAFPVAGNCGKSAACPSVKPSAGLMAELSKAHLWINTGIAISAFLASATSALYAYNTYTLKDESLSFSALPTWDCRIEYQKIGDGGVLGLCWLVTVTNQSDRRTSIISHQAFELEDVTVANQSDRRTSISGHQLFDLKARGSIYRSGYTEIEDVGSGHPTSFPIVLDSGEAKSYIFRVPISVPSSVAKIIESASKTDSASRHLTFKELEHDTFDAGLDILGTPVTVRHFSPDLYDAEYDTGFRKVIGQMKLVTGRGREFNCNMAFPP
jgi:hypothetical protein